MKFEQLFSTDCYLCGCRLTQQNKDVKGVSSLNIECKTNGECSGKFKNKYSGIGEKLVCEHCRFQLPVCINNCFTCGLPLHDTLTGSSDHQTCGQCLISSPVFSRLISAFHYEAPINHFITQLKFSAQFQLLPIMVDFLVKKLIDAYQNEPFPEALVAIPLHPKKQRTRGFNQAGLIANRLSKQLNIPVIDRGIERIKLTRAQSGLDAKERKENIKGAFRTSAQLPNYIAVVDDVITTGLTVSEFTSTVLSQGCQKVHAWSIARAYDI